MDHETDYARQWEQLYRDAYAQGRRHWRPGLATPPAFAGFMQSPAAPPQGAHIIEAGCGDGPNAIHLAQSGYIVTGVDISESAIARARAAADEARAPVSFLCLDLVRQPLPPPLDYDLWIDIKTLHCLWRDEDRRGYLAAARAALRDRGLLFMNCGLALADVRDHFPAVFESLDAATRAQAAIPDRNLPAAQRTGIRCQTLDEYCHELRHAGFSILDAQRQASLQTGWGVIIVAQR